MYEATCIEGAGMGFGVSADAYVDRGFGEEVPAGISLDLTGLAPANFGIGGFFVVECVGPDGKRKWIDSAKNGVTDAGIANVLNTYFGAATQTTVWYLGIVDNAGWTAFAAADTMGSHAGWSEVADGNYSNSVRPTWTPGSAASGSVVNGTTADFNMTNGSALTVKGVFLTSVSTKSGTSGVLFATAAFTGGTKSVSSGDTLKVTYTVSATGS